MNLALRAASVLALAAALAANAQTTAYSNFGTGGAYRTDRAYVVGSAGGSANYSPAFQFTSGASGVVTTFGVAMNNAGSFGNAAYSLSLYADNGSNQLGTLLGTYSGTSTSVDFSDAGAYPVSTVAATNGATLTSGTKYWLLASSAASLGWNPSTASTSGPTFLGITGSQSYGTGIPGAFSVQVAPVQATPEPSALAALGLGAVGLLRRRKRA